MDGEKTDFWTFSTSFYARDGVADACLTLQNTYGFDVNLLLFCFWHGIHFGELDNTILERAWDHSIQWRQQVVQPLRNVRCWMKGNHESVEAELSESFDKLRQHIKADELAAEHIQQQTLQGLIEPPLKPSIKPAITLPIESDFEPSRALQKTPVHDIGVAVRSNVERLCKMMNLIIDDTIEAQIEALLQAAMPTPD